MSKAESLPSSSLQSPNNPKRFAIQRIWLCTLVTASLIAAIYYNPSIVNCGKVYHRQKEQLCTQTGVLVPSNTLWKTAGETIDTDAFKSRAVAWLAGAVQVPTESYDDLGPIGEDARWETFGQFHEYLFSAFPLV